MGNRTEPRESVLLVGDTDQHDVVEDHLSAAGFTVAHAPDLVDALDALDTLDGRFDCLLLAETDRRASAVLQRLRRTGHALPVISLVDEMRADADVAAVATPDAPAGLVARVERIVADHRLDRERAARRRRQAVVDDARDAALSAAATDDAFDVLCRTLVRPGGYDLAWVGRYDPPTGRLEPVAAAGLPLDHLGTVAVTASDTASGWALETGAVAVTGGDDHPTFAVPLGDAPSAVLHVVGDRPGGVSRGERAMLSSLGASLSPAVDGAEPTDATDAVTVLGDTLGHELGNQLEIALTHLELAREQGDDAHFDHVVSALDRLTELADESRQLARGEVDPEPLDLATAVETAWDAVDTTDATLDIDGVGDTIVADPQLLSLLLENLLRNAVEHGTGSALPHAEADAQPDPVDEGKSSVTVRIGTTETGFAVADDGPGIPPGDRERVLEWGYSTGGSGVGLGVVGLIAERHGWTIDVTESAAGGAQFEFEFS